MKLHDKKIGLNSIVFERFLIYVEVSKTSDFSPHKGFKKKYPVVGLKGLNAETKTQTLKPLKRAKAFRPTQPIVPLIFLFLFLFLFYDPEVPYASYSFAYLHSAEDWRPQLIPKKLVMYKSESFVIAGVHSAAL